MQVLCAADGAILFYFYNSIKVILKVFWILVKTVWFVGGCLVLQIPPMVTSGHFLQFINTYPLPTLLSSDW